MITFLKKLDLNTIRGIYMGRLYPILVCALVLLGSLTGLEVYFNFLVIFYKHSCFWSQFHKPF